VFNSSKFTNSLHLSSFTQLDPHTGKKHGWSIKWNHYCYMVEKERYYINGKSCFSQVYDVCCETTIKSMVLCQFNNPNVLVYHYSNVNKLFYVYDDIDDQGDNDKCVQIRLNNSSPSSPSPSPRKIFKIKTDSGCISEAHKLWSQVTKKFPTDWRSTLTF
jgi:hypothetical protein